MNKEELFKNLDKNKYDYETKMIYLPMRKRKIDSYKGYDYTISVLVKNENDEWCRRELFVHSGVSKFFTVEEIKLEDKELIHVSSDLDEDIYGIFWEFIKTRKI